jgi:antitoxin component YwqK of YwqJK toxin-antitoxin module
LAVCGALALAAGCGGEGGGKTTEKVEESYPSGAKKKVSHYAGASAVRTTFYFEDGKMQSDRFFKKGEPDSTMTIYTPEGGMDKQTTYKDGKKNGPEKSWYANGNLKSEVVYAEDAPTGKFTTYYESGQPDMEVVFKDGKKDGEEILYYPDGKKKRVRTYVAGDQDGSETEYFENGFLKLEQQWSKNALNGPFKTYHKDAKGQGKPEATGTYVNGRYDGERVEYDKNGKKVALAIYDKGERTFGERY